jgi:hypothetical protein
MMKTYHLCLSAGEEVLFRDLADYNRGFNSFALSLYRTDSVGLVEAFMATHCHLMLQSAKPDEFMFRFRNSYSKYFNKKYHRSGKLGEECHFALEVVGYHHRVAAASYILRNALHHGVAPIPYAYPHSSVNSIFRQEMGKFSEDRIIDRRYHSRFIGRDKEYPESYKMTENGLFVRESVLDIPQVESLFVSPRMFNYYMSRKSGEEWELEQKKDNNGVEPISLRHIEKSVGIHTLDQMLAFEHGRSDYRRMTDIQLCEIIDRQVSVRYGKSSVYELSLSEKNHFANYLYEKYHCADSQLRRCLVMHL